MLLLHPIIKQQLCAHNEKNIFHVDNKNNLKKYFFEKNIS
jgi:hypothetical protein